VLKLPPALKPPWVPHFSPLLREVGIESSLDGRISWKSEPKVCGHS
jgi:hypothetical protein